MFVLGAFAPFAIGYLIVVALLVRSRRRGSRIPPPDPSMRPIDERQVDDVQWTSIENAWRRFLDDFAPVMDEEPRHG